MGMVEGLKRGFAVANTDMGTAPDINLAKDHPQRWIDFGHRATHEMTRLSEIAGDVHIPHGQLEAAIEAFDEAQRDIFALNTLR